MKKLMVAAVVAMLGIAANAAVFVSWSSGYVEGLGDESTFYTWTGNNDSTLYDAILAAWDSGTSEDLSKTIWDAVQGGDLDMGDADSQGFLMGEAGTSATATKNKPAYGVVLITHTDDGGEIDKVMGNLAMVESVPSGSADVFDLGLFIGGDEGNAATAWYTLPSDGPSEGVPEPTSGLLMLIGLAGLALKRKIA